MMPRGEVGLIFAGIGAALTLGGEPVVSPEVYAAAVFMVVVTTMATPPLLLWSVRRDAARAGGAAKA
jgi:Kef-type K+ transport system membrane component KefB